MIRPANMEHAATATLVICAAILTMTLAIFGLLVHRERGYARTILCPDGCEIDQRAEGTRLRATCWCDTRGD